MDGDRAPNRPLRQSAVRAEGRKRQSRAHYYWTRNDYKEALARIIADRDVIRASQHDQLGSGAFLLVRASDALQTFPAQFGADTENAEGDDPPKDGAADEDNGDFEPNAN